jgi:hypothetical protein
MTKRTEKSMSKKIFALMVLTISTACHRDLSNSQQPLSAGDLTKQYDISKTNVRSMYNGKEIVVRGYVTGTAAMPNVGDNEGQIALDEKGTVSVRQVTCWFSKNDAAEFSKIKGDQYVTVKGVFNGELGAELKFCKLIKIE